tara:strand:- start:1463 stop:3550 length:2088 start_codon:yes stop_codon:yes gene_type:complete
MAKYKGSIFAGIQPLDYAGSQLYQMSRTNRSNHLMSANKTLRYQLMWNGLRENQAPSKEGFSSSTGKGQIINVIFDVYTTTISPPPSDITQWTLTSTIKKTRDIANQNFNAAQPALSNQRFTIDISSICQDVLSYSLVPIKKGTWQSSFYGGMNGGATKQDNVTQTISSYNVTQNGAFRHVWVLATPEVIIANGTIKKVTQNPLSFNRICVINSLVQYELNNPYYYESFLIGEYGTNASARRGFMSFCPNKSVQSGASVLPFAKNVRTDEEAEWLYWYQYKLFISSNRDNYATKARIKITTYSSVGTSQNTCYLSDFNSNLATETRSNLLVFKQSQSVLCAQNLSPVYINLFAQDDSGNLLINQIDNSTLYYKASLVYETAEDNLVLNGVFDSPANWYANNNWSVANNKASSDGSSSASISQSSVTGTAGDVYSITYTVLSVTQGGYQAYIGGDTGTLRTAAGTYTEIFTAIGTDRLRIYPTNDAIGEITNVSVQKNPATLRATEYRFFNIDRETANIPFGFVRFHWLNRAGGIDSYTAKRNVTEGLSVEKSTVEIKSADRTWVQNQYKNTSTLTLNDPENYYSNTMRGGDLYKGGREVLNINANRNNSVFTEPLNKQTADWLQEIITSPNVWIEMDTEATQRNNTANPFQRPSTKGYIPVIINNTDVEILNQDAGLVKFNIEYTLAHKVQTQRN